MKFKFENLVPLIPILFFLVMVFISLETHNIKQDKAKQDKVIVLRANERFINMTWNNTNICITTLDTITNIGYTREYNKDELYSEIKFISNKK